MLCIYHIADHDGKGSGAIVKRVFPEAELLGLNHDMEIPYDIIAQHDKIVVCDFALPVDFMFELSEKIDFTWIDHHASVIDQYNAEILKGKKEIKGVRRVGQAAIELCWQYFYPDNPVPLGVELLAKNDLFDLRDPRVRPFEFAMQSFGVNSPDDKIWTDLFENRLNIEAMIEEGERILSWINVRNYRLVRSMAFEAEIDGLKCICANMPQGYSSFYDSLENREYYDVMINFYMNRKRKWNLSFYSSKKEVDVSRLAAKFGGGGHRGAAGASALDELPDFLRKNIH
ncbi:MAG: DHHA1 domain-containing protein [Azospirillum sp.]|nr:DHHA1 domain-containing protein [Azospirillum sp.]